MRAFSWERFREAPIVGILRGFRPEHMSPLVEAFGAGGLTTLEVTMNSRDAEGQLRAACRAGAGLNVGAGTVTTVEVLRRALDAGASFVVTPVVQPAVIAECARLGVPVFPGAMTPTEAMTARERGADLIKVFPADAWGPRFVRHLKENLPDLGLLPTGGVDLRILGAYRDAGADGVGVGSPLFDRDRIEAGDWEWLRGRCEAFRRAWTGSEPFSAGGEKSDGASRGVA